MIFWRKGSWADNGRAPRDFCAASPTEPAWPRRLAQKERPGSRGSQVTNAKGRRVEHPLPVGRVSEIPAAIAGSSSKLSRADAQPSYDQAIRDPSLNQVGSIEDGIVYGRHGKEVGYVQYNDIYRGTSPTAS